MALLGTLQVRLGLDVATFSQKFGNFTKDLEKRAKGISKGLSGLTNFGSLIGSASLGATLASGIDVAGDFETTINQAAAAAELGDSAIAGLSKQALDLSKAFKTFAPQQVAEGMLELTKAGITPAEQSAGALAETMRLAATEGLALGRAAEVMAEQMGAFGLTAKDTAGIADALAGASIASTASVESLSQGLSQSAKVAKIFGLDLNETAGSLALFASNGLKGSDAGTSLKTMLSRLIPSTDEAAAAMAQYGISFTTSAGKIKDITQVADILRTKLGGLSEAQRNSTLQTIFGSDAIRAAAILTEKGAADLQTYIEATRDQQAAERLSEARTKGYRGAIDALKASFQRIAIELTSGGFLQGLTDLANKGSDLLGKLSGLPQWAKNLGLGIATTAALLPPFALALSSIVTAGPALLTGLGAVTAFLTGPWGIAIAAAVGGAILFKDQLMGAWNDLRAWFSGWVQSNQPLLDQLKSSWSSLVATFGPLFDSLKLSLSNFGTAVAKAFGTDGASLFESFKQAAGGALTGIVQGVTSAIASLTSFVTWLTAELPAAGTSAGETVNGIVQFFKDMGARIGEAWNSVKSAFATARDFLVNGISALWEKLLPLREAFATWGQVASEACGLVKDVALLAFDAIKLGIGAVLTALTPVWEKLKEFGAWIAASFGPPIVAAFQKVKEVAVGIWTEIQTAIQGFWDFSKNAVAGIVQAFEDLGNKALAPLRSLRDGINEARKALNVFGDTGEEETDRAVGHSWLTDLCEKGVSLFKSLVTDGISPAGKALVDFGRTGKNLSFGQGFKLAFAPRAIELDKDGNPVKEAERFEGVWKHSLDNVSSAIDQFIKDGRFNFKGFIDGLAADLASSALKGAFEALFKGLAGLTGDSAGDASTWGNLLGTVLKGFTSFEGGGFTGTGSRTGGLDGRGGMLAMVHPNETVIDHDKIRRSSGARRGGRPVINVTTPINLAPGVSHQELAKILPMLKRDIIQTIPELIAQGGRRASAFGT
ncbi:phage tail tape measure protein [Luteolibacter soli]|uniref:Phage tail tape measure protein n=1 Tax=Luteolibacter soli TaxID=3135280 RepID=A0ABU9AYZ9_9BACT